MTGRHRIEKGQRIFGTVISSSVVTLSVQGWAVDDQGRPFEWTVPAFATAGTRTVELLGEQSSRFDRSGWITGLAVLFQSGTSAKRGQVYVQVVSGDEPSQTDSIHDVLAQGYAYSGHVIMLDENVESGPGGGNGFLSWVTLASDVAGNVDTSTSLAATNTIRKWYGYAWYYNASADAATRTLNARIDGLGSTLPTGFATAADSNWTSPTLTLTASEEGSQLAMNVHHGDGFISNDDATAMAYGSTATAPIPFPLLVPEEDIGTLELIMGSGHANDRYSAYGLIEEWLVL